MKFSITEENVEKVYSKVHLLLDIFVVFFAKFSNCLDNENKCLGISMDLIKNFWEKK